jgi:FAD/FMN-containing dehydrogenase
MTAREVDMALTIATLDGRTAAVDERQLEALRSRIRGDVLTSLSPQYDQARAVWNAIVDRRPALIVRCATAADVQEAVRFAAAAGMLLSIKGGGHNIAGSAVVDDGLMIDCSPMKRVVVDVHTRRARVEPGVTLGEFDAEAQRFGLAAPLGINSTTGIAGLTLGGGFGWLTRKHGLTIDNLVSAEIVTADGQLRQVSQREHADLFWAIRGGGGNFGVVTSFEFALHEVGPEVLAGLIVHPFDRARSLIETYRRFVATTPDELSCWLVFRKAPPLPFLPARWHGREVVVVVVVYSGEIDEGERLLAPLRNFAPPIADLVGPTLYTSFQQAFDPLLTPGARNYWKSHDLRTISDAAVDTIIDFSSQLPTPDCEIFVAQLAGAAARISPEAMAFARRDAEFVLNVHTRWDDAADDDRCIAWARAFFTAMTPHALGSVYVNFMPADEPDRVHAAYGPNFARLAAIKGKWDPSNLFRMNQNIEPATV